MSKTIPFDVDVLKAFTDECIAAKIGYAWGGKVKHNAVPGKDFKGLDCSGFVDEAVYRASGGELDLPAGSWGQEEDIKAAGFDRCANEDGNKRDGVVRIAFYPGVAPNPIRHVALVVNDRTHESHGGVGVARRDWVPSGWQSKSNLYVLARPNETSAPAATVRESMVLGKPIPGIMVGDSAYLGLKALQKAGLLVTVSLGAGHAKVYQNTYGTSVLPLEIVDGVGYVPARLLASLMEKALSWDNKAKRVTIT